MSIDGKLKVVSISLRNDQIEFLQELSGTSKISKSEIIRQCLDRAAPDLIAALEAMKKHGFRPATKGERMRDLRKIQKKK